MNAFEIVRDEASKVYNNKEELDAFMQGFEKQAGAFFGDALNLTGKILTNPLSKDTVAGIGGRAAIGLAAGLVGMGIYKAINSTSSAINNNALKSKFESALQYVKTHNLKVKNYNQSKVDSFANTLFTLAPHVASDPNLLDTLLDNAILGGGVDLSISKAVTDIENTYSKTNEPKQLMGIHI